MLNLYTTKDGYNMAVIDNNGVRPPKLETQNWFLGKLIEDINSITLMEELMKAVVDGSLLPDDVDVIINKAHAARMNSLLVGFDNSNTMQYNHNYGGEYEQKPPFGWGQ